MGVWHREIKILLLSLFLISIVGGLTGLFLPLLCGLSISLIVRHATQMTRFEHWVSLGGKGRYPKTKGIWEEVYYHVYRIRKVEKRRKKQLRKIIDEFRQSTEALPDAAVVLSANDEIEWANKSAREVLGLQQSDKGQRIPNLIRFPEFIRYLKLGNYSESVVLPSPVNSHITLSVRIVSYGPDRRLLLAQDVTQLKKMERMRKDFVANVSHELRTPLTVLKGYLETLQDMDNGDSPLLSGSLQQMQGQTERMQHLVDNLLLLTHLETHQKKFECVDVPALLSQICNEGDILKNVSQTRIQLTLEIDSHIHGEEHELRSAFTNLMSNALKYSPEDSVVKVRWYRSEDSVCLDVEDQGEGIAAENIPRITERFFRVEVKRSKKIGGTGLGLAIVKHVLMRHDGTLNIVSEPSKGSCFSCRFPINRLC